MTRAGHRLALGRLFFPATPVTVRTPLRCQIEMLRATAITGAGLALVFAIGACAAFTDKTGHWVLFPLAALIVVGTAFLAGRYSPGWPVLLGVVVGLGAPVAAIFGNFAVYQIGIDDLASRDFGSPDIPGLYYALLSIVLFSPVIVGISAITGLLAGLGHSRRSAETS